MRIVIYIVCAAGLLLSLLLVPALAASPKDDILVGQALAMHGDVKYRAGFKNFDYVNPNAPKGGSVKLADIGTFDNLNPFILKGMSPAGIGLLFDTLLISSLDEPFTEYGLIVETIEIPRDRSWVAYTLRREARFHDGSPITAEDVIFTLETLKTKGHPFYRSYYANVAKAEKVGENKVKFSFSPGENRELPLIMGQMPVLSKAYWSTRSFDKTTLDPPLGSGPYKIEAVDPGRSITYRRVKDYWGAHLPVNAGRNNIDQIRYDYYRDTTVALEAFKAGAYDFRQENVAKEWATGYNVPAVKEGRIKKEEIPNEMPTGMQGFVFNTRRTVFQDRKVREALGYAFDFEWANKNLFNGAYTRTTSYFSNSELASKGLPSKEELEILNFYRGRIPEEVFNKEYRPPVTDGSGNIRDNLRNALDLLSQAGWKVENKKLINVRTRRPMEFEILLDNPSFERIALPFIRNLERLGITAHLRTVDATQYQNRMDKFDFDITVAVFPQSLSPGNEQRDFWGSAKAGLPGSRNLAGIKDMVIDDLVNLVISAPDRQSLIYRTRALDRVLLWGHYVIPHWHVRVFRVAYWDRIGRPKVTPKYSLGFDTWWVDPAKDAAISKHKSLGEKR